MIFKLMNNWCQNFFHSLMAKYIFPEAVNPINRLT